MNEALTQRLRAALKGRKRITEKPMFGGACFMLRGNMLCGTGKSDLPGFVWVEAGCDARALKRWVELAEKYVGTLPPKKQKEKGS